MENINGYQQEDGYVSRLQGDRDRSRYKCKRNQMPMALVTMMRRTR